MCHEYVVFVYLSLCPATFREGTLSYYLSISEANKMAKASLAVELIQQIKYALVSNGHLNGLPVDQLVT